MNDLISMLAQTAPTPSPIPSPDVAPVLPANLTAFLERLRTDNLLQLIVNISWLEAAVCIAFGIIYLTYGWRVYKALVVINFAGIGLFVGMFIGRKLGSPLWGGMIGTFAAATFSWPFRKYCVSVLGGLAGTVICASLWRMMNLPEMYLWCGALVGLVAGGLLVFSSFKISVLFFTSLQGSMFVVIGALALINDYPELGIRLNQAVNGHVFVLPMLFILPTAIGMFFQQKLLKQEADWAMPE